eukprot:8588740-Alexandrium_andersonii.AAC.1
MSASLVGSEMCIRDRKTGRSFGLGPQNDGGARGQLEGCKGAATGAVAPVSYTHLTLPTICSV